MYWCTQHQGTTRILVEVYYVRIAISENLSILLSILPLHVMIDTPSLHMLLIPMYHLVVKLHFPYDVYHPHPLFVLVFKVMYFLSCSVLSVLSHYVSSLCLSALK